MSVVLDAVLLGVIILMIFIGLKNGLIISLFNLFSSLAAIILAFLFYPFFAEILKKLPVYGWIREPVYNSISHIGTANAQSLVEKLNFPGGISDNIINQINEKGMNNNINEISDAVTDFLIKIISVIILFILIKIVFIFIKKIIKKITKIPVLHQADKIGGFIIGALEAFIILTLIGALFNLFNSKIDSGVIKIIDNSIIGRFFYHNNLITAFLTKIK